MTQAFCIEKDKLPQDKCRIGAVLTDQNNINWVCYYVDDVKCCFVMPIGMLNKKRRRRRT